MNHFLGDQSVLFLDNCQIHKCKELQKALESKGSCSLCTQKCGSHKATGCILKFIPVYLPDLNPIEESFSAGEEMQEEIGARY